MNDKALQELICRIDCSSNAENVTFFFLPQSLSFLNFVISLVCVGFLAACLAIVHCYLFIITSFNTHRANVFLCQELDKAMAEEAFRLFTDKVMLYVASDVHSPPLHVIPL